MLLNLSIFIWFGAVCPWESFRTNSVVSIYHLVVLGILILLLRRLPILFALRKYIHQIEGLREALFMGFFGPIGVSAIFYLYISLEFLETLTIDGVQRDDARKLGEVITLIIWFLAICSNVS
jgi:sodium/hydrogen antiporter